MQEDIDNLPLPSLPAQKPVEELPTPVGPQSRFDELLVRVAELCVHRAFVLIACVVFVLFAPFLLVRCTEGQMQQNINSQKTAPAHVQPAPIPVR